MLENRSRTLIRSTGEMDEEFVTWLQREITARGWSQAEFARRAEISNQLVSVVLMQQQKPGLRFMQGAARALGVTQAEIMQRAGRLPKTGNLLPSVADWNRRLSNLSETNRDAAIKAMEQTLTAIEAVARLTVAL